MGIKVAIAKLEELQQAYPGAARFGYTTRVQREDSHPKAAAAEIYLNGELTVDFPEDVKVSVEPNQMVTAELVGSSVKLNYCELDRAIRLQALVPEWVYPSGSRF